MALRSTRREGDGLVLYTYACQEIKVQCSLVSDLTEFERVDCALVMIRLTVWETNATKSVVSYRRKEGAVLRRREKCRRAVQSLLGSSTTSSYLPCCFCGSNHLPTDSGPRPDAV